MKLKIKNFERLEEPLRFIGWKLVVWHETEDQYVFRVRTADGRVINLLLSRDGENRLQAIGIPREHVIPRREIESAVGLVNRIQWLINGNP